MGHERSEHKQALGPPAATVARALALLLVVCLVECASGSCLSYGHSCWGAHGKRSGQAPLTLPKGSDWYLMRLLRRMSALDLPQVRQPQTNDNRDLSDIFRIENSDENSNSISAIDNVDSDEANLPMEMRPRRRPDAIPMLDEDNLANYKLMQLMRGASIEK